MEQFSLQDFEIHSGADLGTCGNKGSFRGKLRKNGLPVLLHRFRPAEYLLDSRPIIKDAKPPDFTVPFVTRFTSIFIGAGTAYLVEPLPLSITLTDAWRSVLAKSPKNAFGVVKVLIEQLLPFVSPRQEKSFHGVHLDNIVLTMNSSYGILADCIDSEDGPIQLRSTYPIENGNLFPALSIVIEKLLEMEASMAKARNRQILPYDIHKKISQFALLIKTISKETLIQNTNINELAGL